MIYYLIAGGPVMIPIGVLSVVAMAVFLERMWHLRRERVIPRALARRIQELLSQRRTTDAMTLVQAQRAPLARLAEVVLEHREKGRAEVKERVGEAGVREAADLERFVYILGVAGSIGPLLGLAGTISGMIGAFGSLNDVGVAEPAMLAKGIAEALISTMSGIVVAIPAVVGHKFLLNRVDVLVLELEEAVLGYVDQVTSSPTDGAP